MLRNRQVLKRIIILTSNELRHQYFRKKIGLNDKIEVLRAYCETEENLLEKGAVQSSSTKRQQHLLSREQSEKDFFELFVRQMVVIHLVKWEQFVPYAFYRLLYLVF